MELNEPKNEDVVKFLDTLTAEEQLRGETTEENFDESLSRKILADIFIDDRNIGGMMGWGEIYQIISKKTGSKNPKQFKKKKNRFFGRL